MLVKRAHLAVMKTKQVQTRWSDRFQHFCWGSHPPLPPGRAVTLHLVVLGICINGVRRKGVWKLSLLFYLLIFWQFPRGEFLPLSC